MKPFALLALLVLTLALPWACTSKSPVGPLATYNLTATFTNTVTLTPTNWNGYTNTFTPSGPTNTQTATCTNTMTPTNSSTGVVTNTRTSTSTSTATMTPTNTWVVTPALTQSPFTTGKVPNGLGYTSSGSATIYVAEGALGSTGGQIEIFNTSGTLLNTLTTSNGTNAFAQPNGVACNGVSIYVIDQGNNTLYRIDPTNLSSTVSLTHWTATGGGPATFSSPEGIAIDPAGNIYVADTGNDYIEVFDSSFNPLSELGGPGTITGNFDNPSALAVTVNGGVTQVYVTDAGNHRVQELKMNGTLSYNNLQFSTSSSSDIYGIALDGSGDIFTADVAQGLVEEYNSVGVLVTQGLGLSATNPSPDGLVFVGSNLLISDYTNSKLYLVTP